MELVGVAGFEPATTRTPSVCATRLRHTPTEEAFVTIRTLEDYTGTTDRKTISARVRGAPLVAFHQTETLHAPRRGARRSLASDLFLGSNPRPPLIERSQIDRERPCVARLIDDVHDLAADGVGRDEMIWILAMRRVGDP